MRKEGVNVKIDIDGDGIFDYNFTSDSELTYNEYMDAMRGSQDKNIYLFIIIIIITIFSLLGLTSVLFLIHYRRKVQKRNAEKEKEKTRYY